MVIIDKFFEINTDEEYYFPDSFFLPYPGEEGLDIAIAGLLQKLCDDTGLDLDIGLEAAYHVVDKTNGKTTFYSPHFESKEKLFEYLWDKVKMIPYVFRITKP
jgi:hypothetical protein